MKTPLVLFLVLCFTTGAVRAIDIVSSGVTGNQVKPKRHFDVLISVIDGDTA